MPKLAAVILAAGMSTRMRSRHSKVLHRLAGRPVISYPIEAARDLGAVRIIVVRGPRQDDLRDYLKDAGVEEAIQKKPLGTADAVRSAAPLLRGFEGRVLILCGDVPLIESEGLSSFVEAVRSKKAVLGVLTMQPEDPAPYGRIIRDLDGRLIKIVERKDASENELKIREVNSGILCVNCEWLFKTIKRIGCENAKNEYYITDLIGLALKEGTSVFAFRGEPAENYLGINDRVDLARAAEIMRERINRSHMRCGVGLLDYRHTHVDAGVEIGADTEVMPFSFFLGRTKVGSDCVIENGVVLRDAVVGNGVHIKSHSVIEGSCISDGAVVGPFARIRPDSKVGKGARVGNFVELKKCEMKMASKANHLTYLGDAVVGARANIGCGTITCNYDGIAKHRTIIGDDAFVGSDTQFVAPVKIGRGATIGAGSTITKDVPADALAISRADQKINMGWSARRRKKA